LFHPPAPADALIPSQFTIDARMLGLMSDHLHSFFDWQCATLMYAYDVVSPLSRDDTAQIDQRKEQVEKEVAGFCLPLIPKQYHDNPELDLPPEIVAAMTRATLRRASEIVATK
jgi:hypothetical protein